VRSTAAIEIMTESSSLTARLAGRAHDLIFGQVHSRRLVFNACWEDPRIDRQLLRLDQQSRVLAISSAGCNVLDYLLDDPARLHAVDLNPRQNAVLWLKMKLIERGDYSDLFAVFGRGSHPGFKEVFSTIERELPDYAREFWSAKMHYVDGTHRRGTFYYHGASGDAAWLFARVFLRAQRRLRQTVEDLLNATSLDEQPAVYDRLEPRLWNRVSRWLVGQPFFLSLLGTPRPQAQLIERSHSKGVPGYVQDHCRHVATRVPMHDNYFWRVYVTGHYSARCCPNYLRHENFDTLLARVNRITVCNGSIADHLRQTDEVFTHFVLLDHQDWLAYHDPAALEEEWRLILEHSQPGTRILMRSAGPTLEFLPDSVRHHLEFHPELTEPLHRQDRVGTYASLHLAEVL
jgi:S-adenosylmethionine-diacylglycerol 3-amino-3-carboxypropyl transferase